MSLYSEYPQLAAKRRALLINIPLLLLALIIWGVFCKLVSAPEDLLYFLQTHLLGRGTSAADIDPLTVTVIAVFSSTVGFLAVLLTFTAITGIAYDKLPLNAAICQLNRKFVFFALVPHLLVCNSYEFLFYHLPAKNPLYEPPIPCISPLLELTAAFDLLVLVCLVFFGIVFFSGFSYGILPNLNLPCNIICGVLWIIYLYDNIYTLTIYPEYGVFFAVYIIFCYLIIALAMVTARNRPEYHIRERYRLLLVPTDADADSGGFDSAPHRNENGLVYDMSLFEPKQNGGFKDNNEKFE